MNIPSTVPGETIPWGYGTGVVYGLHHPGRKGLFYVGATIHSLEKRMGCHMSHARDEYYSGSAPNYIRERMKCQRPVAIVLEYTFEHDLLSAEKRWIETCLRAGHRLVNGNRRKPCRYATFPTVRVSTVLGILLRRRALQTGQEVAPIVFVDMPQEAAL